VYGYWKVEMIVPNLEKGKLIFRPLIKLAKALLVAKKDSDLKYIKSKALINLSRGIFKALSFLVHPTYCAKKTILK
jgi:hypothetical protein